METSGSSVTSTRATRQPVKLAIQQALTPALLIILAVLSILTGDLLTALQVIIGDVAGAVRTEGALAISLERLSASQALANRLANTLSITAVLGGIIFATAGEGRAWIRVATLTIVLLLMIRAYFWTIA